MARLTGTEIIKEVAKERIIIDPFKEEHVGPNSIDLTLAPMLMYYTDAAGGLDMKKAPATTQIQIPEVGFCLLPGKLYLGSTNERAGSDYFAPTIAGRSSIGRLGLFVHVTAGFGDLGFKDHWTLELLVHHPLMIYPNIRICQMAFDTVEGTRDLSYFDNHRGKYDQRSPFPVASKMWKDFPPEH